MTRSRVWLGTYERNDESTIIQHDQMIPSDLYGYSNRLFSEESQSNTDCMRLVGIFTI